MQTELSERKYLSHNLWDIGLGLEVVWGEGGARGKKDKISPERNEATLLNNINFFRILYLDEYLQIQTNQVD